MNWRLAKDILGWGIVLWLIGYVIGMMLFSIVPLVMIGWIILPIGIIITLWVLFKKVNGESFIFYFSLSVAWTLIAILFDYFFIVKAFSPADGYYKLDVYLYYALVFILPLIVGWRKNNTKNKVKTKNSDQLFKIAV